MKLVNLTTIKILIFISFVSCNKQNNNCADTPIVNSGNCIDSTMIYMNMTNCCTEEWAPVCGCIGITYSNPCHATIFGAVTSYIDGECCEN